MGELAELYGASLDAFNRRDREGWLALADPELENHPPRDWPEPAVTKGAEAVWDFFVSNFDTWGSEAIEVDEMVAEREDRLLARLHADVRGESSGIEIEWSYLQAAWFRDGRLVRLAWFSDRDEALAALELG